MNMRAERDDRPVAPTRGRSKLPLIIIALIIAAIAIWFVTKPEQSPPSPPVVLKAPDPEPESPSRGEIDPMVKAAPSIPQQLIEPVATAESINEEDTLPALNDSDNFTRDLLAADSDSDQLSVWLGTDSLIPKSVAVIDALAKGEVARKILPSEPVEGKFNVVMEQDIPWLDDNNFVRYDNYVNAVTSIPPASLAASFHTLRPLLEQAYRQLGRDGSSLDKHIIAAIDRMLLTPDHNGPFALEQKSVLYQFADPSLEALPGVQKQLLRIGPDNRAKIKNYLKELRVALLADNAAETMD